MLAQAVGAVKGASESGINRYVLRLFLPRDGELTPPDESWVGGIMQLFATCSPVRECTSCNPFSIPITNVNTPFLIPSTALTRAAAEAERLRCIDLRA